MTAAQVALLLASGALLSCSRPEAALEQAVGDAAEQLCFSRPQTAQATAARLQAAVQRRVAASFALVGPFASERRWSRAEAYLAASQFAAEYSACTLEPRRLEVHIARDGASASVRGFLLFSHSQPGDLHGMQFPFQLWLLHAGDEWQLERAVIESDQSTLPEARP